MSERVVLVDGSALVYRAYFALPPHLKTRHGVHTNAVFGFASMFKKLFAAKRPRFGAVVFDPPGPTTRDLQYPHYKAQRAGMDEELVEQLPLIDRVVEANRFPVVRVPGLEADDVIGTLARQALDRGHEVAIVSSDKDFAQLIGDRCWMQDTIKDVSYDAELVKKKWGVRPDQMVDLLALMGDASDNIPGVDGIGQKGAQLLLEEHGSLAALLQRFDADPEHFKGRTKRALAEGRESALLSQRLATIDQHAALPVSIEQLVIEPPDPARTNPLYKELELYSLLSREEVKDARAEHSVGGELLVCDTPDAVRAALPALEGTAALELLFEGGPIHGDIAGIALSAQPGRAIYVPLDDARLRALTSWLQDPAQKKVVHDAKAAMVLLRQRGVTLRGVVLCTRLGSFLVDPNNLIAEHHALEAVAKEYLQRALAPQKELVGSGKEQRRLLDVDHAAAARFGAERVHAVRELMAPLSDLLKERAQQRTHDEVELPLSSVLGEMERLGIAVDGDALATVGAELRERRGALERDIHALAGRSFNVASPKQLEAVLFDELMLPVQTKTKSGRSTNAEVLERLVDKHPIAQKLLEFRKLDKLITTYTDVLQAAIHPRTRRVHATFQQTVGVTGRLITMDPDLQRTPTKSADGQRIREAFVARPLPDGSETVLIDADWSQIELRLLAHFSEDPILLECFKTGVDVHRRTAAEVFGKAPSDVTKKEREVGKTVNFATLYGQGALALSQLLDVPRREAEAYQARYFEVYAGVRAWLDAVVARAHERGYAETLLGRRRIIPELSSKSADQRSFGERVAQNTPIQGSAADLCKLAMLRLHERLHTEAPRTRMVLQIHDELVLESPLDEVEAASAATKDVMEHVVALKAPLVADVGVGPSWGAAKR